MARARDPEPHHPEGSLPSGSTWADVVGFWRGQLGGWTPLAEELVRRGGAGLPRELGTIERGLRRLAERGQRDGGQYGRWVTRLFGLPPETEAWLRWLGQYHSRFADLPVPLRERQLAMWDRPPVCDSAAGGWVDLGVASVAMRKRDRASIDARLARAARKVERATTAALLEHRLVAARVASDDLDHAQVERLLEEARPHLDAADLVREDALSYRARWLDAMAYRELHPPRGEPRVEAALSTYEAIPERTGVPFVDLRRALGRSYCMHRLGRSELALALAHQAAEHAADGGLVRLRAMALNLASHIAQEPDASRLRAQAHRIATRLEDEELAARVERLPARRG